MDRLNSEPNFQTSKEDAMRTRQTAAITIQEFKRNISEKNTRGTSALDNYLQAQIDFAKANAVLNPNSKKSLLETIKTYQKPLLGTLDDKRQFCNERVNELLAEVADPKTVDLAEKKRLQASGWLVLGGSIN